MPNNEKPPAEQAIALAFEASLELLEPSEEQELAELGMEDYAALVDADGEGTSED